MLATPPRAVEDHALPGIVADATTGQAAYLRTATTLVVRHTTGKPQTFTVDDGCRPAVVATGAVGLNCGAVALIVPTNGGTPTPVPGTISSLGTRWVEVLSGGRDTIVDRRSGSIIDLAKDPFGVHNALDLDKVTPVDRLCAGAKRSPGTAARRYAPSVLIGGRFVEGRRVYDCSTRRTRRVPKGAQVSATAVAYRRGGRVVLGTRRYRATSFALSATGLWLQGASGAIRVLATQ